MIQDILLSVVIPVYNAEKTILSLLENLKEQLPPNCELILINDGSKDRSEELISNYLCENIKLLNQTNQGVSAARNKGIELSNGKYISFIDSDDNVSEKYFEEILLSLNDNPDLVLFGIRSDYQDYSENFEYASYSGGFSGFKKEENFFVYHTTNSPCNKVYRRDIFSKYDISYDMKISNSEDFKLNMNFFPHVNQVNVLTEILYFYNCKNESSLSKKYADNQCQIEIANICKINNLVDLSDRSTENYYFLFLVNSFLSVLKRDIANDKLTYKRRKNNFKESLKLIELRNNEFDKKRRLIDKLFILICSLNSYSLFYLILMNYSWLSKVYLMIKKD